MICLVNGKLMSHPYLLGGNGWTDNVLKFDKENRQWIHVSDLVDKRISNAASYVNLVDIEQYCLENGNNYLNII